MSARTSSIPVGVGLYALRVVGAASGLKSGLVTVRPARGLESSIEIITAPDQRPGTIGGSDGCLVVRASRRGSLDVSVDDAAGAGGSEIELRLEWLAGGTGLAEQEGDVGAKAGLARLELTGHVSRRGDVKVTGDTWIAGPDAPAPIEGIQAQLAGDTPDLELSYQVLVGGGSGVWTDWYKGNAYAGTRGQFRPLLAVRLRLRGSAGSQYGLQASGLFLGSTVQSVLGQEVELISGSGVDPLVGLKIALKELRTGLKQHPTMASPNDQQSGGRGGRVRVFRASGAR